MITCLKDFIIFEKRPPHLRSYRLVIINYKYYAFSHFGNITRNSLPLPTSLLTSKFPEWASIIFLHWNKPIPRPLDLLLLNGLKRSVLINYCDMPHT